jgi:hypothetical protein
LQVNRSLNRVVDQTGSYITVGRPTPQRRVPLETTFRHFQKEIVRKKEAAHTDRIEELAREALMLKQEA